MLDHRSESVESSGLQSAANGFHGRVEELAEVGDLLGRARLVTVTGPPGVGKTRLSSELADRRSEAAVLIELAPVTDPALVARSVARALGVAEESGGSLDDGIVAHLRCRRHLLLLDNCEHVLRASRELTASLLDRCPDLVILATSREPLGVEGECVWPLAPLAVPTSEETSSPETLTAYPAVSLFIERARAVQPGFALNSYTARAVADICRGLDGVPLAIELAAARVGTLNPAEIARRLDGRLVVLGRGGPHLPDRHQTLEAAFDWSHELLSEPERALLRRLAVFAGGFEFEPVEAICAGDGVEAGEVAGLFAGLVSKSLIAAGSRRGHRARYRLLETIAGFARERLDWAGEAAGRREGHARFYLDLAEAAEPELSGPRQDQWFERLDGERENLRAALEWSLSNGRWEWALRLGGSLVLFWRVRCHFSEGRELLEAALAVGEGEPVRLRAQALWGWAFLTMMEGNSADVIPALEQSVAMFRELGEPRGLARALLILGNALQDDRRFMPLLEESAALAREVGDTWCLAHALAIAGIRRRDVGGARELFEQSLEVARDTQSLRIGLLGLGADAARHGDLDRAQSALSEALRASESLGEDYAQAHALTGLADVSFQRGDYDHARELLERTLALLPRHSAGWTHYFGLIRLARVCHAQGDLATARIQLEQAASVGQSPFLLYARAELASLGGDAEGARLLLAEALKVARSSDKAVFLDPVLLEMGRVSRAAGRQTRAAAFYDEALAIQCQRDEKPGIVSSIEALAGLASDAGRHARAALLLGAAHALREREGYARTPWEDAAYDVDLGLIRAGLAADDFTQAFTEGAELSIEEAVVLARNGGRRRRRPSSGWSSLTEREREVAQLAAEGLSNPEIAERLLISRATVKNHLLHIFPKLGVSSREEM